MELPELAGLELLDELGRGAQTVVYRARRDGREYAVKMLRPEAHPQGEGARTMLRREASVLASLRHPGLAQIFAIGDVDGRPYLVMELIEGGSLAELLDRRGRL